MIRFRIGGLAVAAAVLLSPLTTPVRAAGYFNAWLQEYLNGADESQGAKAITIDSRGNVIVTGFAQKSGNGSANRVYTVKYDGSDGHIVWERFLASTNAATPASVAVDSNDAVIVAGTLNNGDDDIFVMKYNSDGSLATGFSSLGAAAPVTYDGTAGGQDVAAKVVVDGANNIIVAGRSVGSAAAEDFQILKYGPTGTLLNEERTNSTNRKDFATDVAIGPNNTIIGVGAVTVASADTRFHIRKLNANFTSAFAAKTINTGGRGGATAVVVNQTTGDIYATGLLNVGNGNQGYYTIKYDSAGVFKWDATVTPTDGDFEATAASIALGPDGNPVVTGYQKTVGGTFFARTIKYQASPPSTDGVEMWRTDDTGFIGGDTRARKVVVDAANNVIVVGESENSHGNQNSFDNEDVYIAKYDGATGEKIFVSGFEGSFGTDDKGADTNALPFAGTVDLVVDAFGDFAITSTPIRVRSTTNSTGRSEIATLKFKRFIIDKGDTIPPSVPEVPEGATFSTGNAPAISDNGVVVAKVTFAAGRSKKSAILVQGSGGDTALPAVQSAAAPNAVGAAEGKFSSFSDPVIAPNGDYAFAAKISGVPASKSNGVWQSVGGNLRRVLQQGTAIPGLDDVTFKSVTSMSMRNGQLIVFGKVSGPAARSAVLLGINAAGVPTVLARAGVTPVTVGADEPSLIKTITVLSPTVESPGDGRWQSTTGITTVRLALASKRSVLARITAAGTITPLLFSGQDATGVADTTYRSFSFPAISAGLRFSVLATLQGKAGVVTGSSDTALVYNDGTATFTAFAREGGDAPAVTNLSGLDYAGFSNPAIGSNGVTPTVAFIATLKGAGVKASNKKALIYGSPTGNLFNAARTGFLAPAPAPLAGQEPENETKFSAISAFAMPSGAAAGPIFVAKLSGPGTNAKNNTGVFAVDSTGATKRLLRTGQHLGDRTIKTILLLKPVPKAVAAARSFNNNGAVAVAITFTNRETAFLRLSVP